MSRVGAALAIALVGAVCACGQTPTPPGGFTVLGFSLTVKNVERSVEFYHDAIGLYMPKPPLPFSSDPWVMDTGNTPGAQSRSAFLYIPGSTLWVELIEYKDIDRKAVHPRFQDPGAATLILTVLNMDAILAKLKAAHAYIVSKRGESATIKGPNRSTSHVVFVQDPDGFFVEISQRDPAPATTASAWNDIIGGAFEIVAADLDQTLKIYRDVLGFHASAPTEWDGTKLRMDAAGTPGAQFRSSVATIPGINGTPEMMAFMEFKDIHRRPLHTRVQDPATAVLLVFVSDVQATVNELKAAGLTVISKDGEPVKNGSTKYAMLRDPNNLFLELMQVLDLGLL